jgi:hypothetical protein
MIFVPLYLHLPENQGNSCAVVLGFRIVVFDNKQLCTDIPTCFLLFQFSKHFTSSSVAQRIEQQISNLLVVGSNPTRTTCL